MKISKYQLRLIIENVLSELDNTDPKQGVSADLGKTDPDIDMHVKKATGSRTKEDDIQAITDYRKGSDRSRFPAMGFGDMEGLNTVSQDLHEPDLADMSAVDKYRFEKNIGDREKSAFDDEHTNPYVYDSAHSPKNSSSKSEHDYSKNYNILADTEDVETFEDESGKERTYMGKEEITPRNVEDESGGKIANLRKYFEKFIGKK
jgi:hypothetical protein